MEENKNNKQAKNQDQQENTNDSNAVKTTQDFTGYPHYPANKEMLKEDDTENLSADNKSFNAPDSGENVPTNKEIEELRGEMDHDSNDLPGKKDNENKEN